MDTKLFGLLQKKDMGTRRGSGPETMTLVICGRNMDTKLFGSLQKEDMGTRRGSGPETMTLVICGRNMDTKLSGSLQKEDEEALWAKNHDFKGKVIF
ncbi:hypothetical protein QE152_g26232 [Popillia japonica]|uniref:Uncharacterized protein n=1 Tax=Popillia japonica TaxID=7064 RepID=A0AAW1JYF3_POPJA